MSVDRDQDEAISELATELAEARTEANVLEARLAKVPALVEAAKRAARKMKREYDRVKGGPPPANECWAECERLWDEIEAWESE